MHAGSTKPSKAEEAFCRTVEAASNGAFAAEDAPSESKKRVTEGPDGQPLAYPVAVAQMRPVLGVAQHPSSSPSPGQSQVQCIFAGQGDGAPANEQACLANGHAEEDVNPRCSADPALPSEAKVVTLPGGGQAEVASGSAELVRAEEPNAGGGHVEKTGPQAESGSGRLSGGGGGELNNIVPFVREQQSLTGDSTPRVAQHVSDPGAAKQAAAEERRLEALARWVLAISSL